MGKHIRNILFLFLPFALFLLGGPLRSQEAPRQGYYIDDNMVVFVFDIRQYSKATEGNNGTLLDFEDLGIEEVAISGDFNHWSAEGWKMKKTGPYTFQLRKKVSDFSDRFPMEFKYIINETYWVSPTDLSPDKKNFSNQFLKEVYDLGEQQIVPSENGNTCFFLAGFEDVNQVILAGEFNDWDENFLKMSPVPGGWQIRIDLPPGRYEYKFIADGKWLHDPENPNFVMNEHLTFNSVLLVTTKIAFELKGFPEARQVAVAGTFNNWSLTPLERGDNSWAVTLDLTAGKHSYKFLVDGRWMVDPQNPLQEKGRTDISYSVLIVR